MQASAVTAYVRITFAVAIPFTLITDHNVRIALLAACGFILAIMPIYEYLKGRIAAQVSVFTRLNSTKIALYVVVGWGYAIRVATGLYVGRAGHLGVALLVLCLLLMAAFGSMFVLMTWALEGSSYVADFGEPKHRVYVTGLVVRGNLGALLAPAGLPLDHAYGSAFLPNDDLGSEPILRNCVRSNQPWSVAAIASLTLAGPFGLLLVSASPQIVPLLAAVLVSLILGVGVTSRIPTRITFAAAFLVVAAIAAMSEVDHTGHTVRDAILAPLPLFIVLVTYFGFRGASYDKLTAKLYPRKIAGAIIATIGTWAEASVSVGLSRRVDRLDLADRQR
jgi:hypothetical protein